MAQVYYFSSMIDENLLRSKNIKIYDSKVSTLNGYTIEHKRNINEINISDSFLKEDINNFVQGMSFLIDENDLSKIDKIEKYPNNRNKLNVMVSFRGDKKDIPLKEAIVYVGKDDFNSSRAIENWRPQKQMMKIKSENKTLAMDYNKKLGGAHMVTFEQYKEDLEYKKLNENYLILEDEKDQLFNKVTKDIEEQKKEKDDDFSTKVKKHLEKYKTIYTIAGSTLALSLLTFFVLKSFKESNFKKSDGFNPGNFNNSDKISDEGLKKISDYKKEMDILYNDYKIDYKDYYKKQDEIMDDFFEKIKKGKKIDNKDNTTLEKLHDELKKLRVKRDDNLDNI